MPAKTLEDWIADLIVDNAALEVERDRLREIVEEMQGALLEIADGHGAPLALADSTLRALGVRDAID